MGLVQMRDLQGGNRSVTAENGAAVSRTSRSATEREIRGRFGNAVFWANAAAGLRHSRAPQALTRYARRAKSMDATGAKPLRSLGRCESTT